MFSVFGLVVINITGTGARPDVVPVELMNFLKHQIPGALYVLSVCTGSWILSGTGILDGKRATTNKFAFNTVKVRYFLILKSRMIFFCLC